MNRADISDRPSLTHGIVVAALLAVAGGAMFAALTVWFTPHVALRWVATLLAGSYGLYLLSNTTQRTGRIVAVFCWCAGAIGIATFVNSLALFLIAHTAMIWLLRSLYFHNSIVAALADLGLSALALAVAVWAAMSSASVWLALWCLFLTQALFVLLPRKHPESSVHDGGNNSEFERARRSADAALRRLVAMDR
jgi:hypothetical protein